jgi:hypothetical protein
VDAVESLSLKYICELLRILWGWFKGSKCFNHANAVAFLVFCSQNCAVLQQQIQSKTYSNTKILRAVKVMRMLKLVRLLRSVKFME